MQLGLIYGKKLNRIPLKNLLLYGLLGYTNNNFAGDFEDHKWVIGYYFFLNKVIVLQNSKK